MFRKIVSNIPFHPAMMGQLTFYLHRLRQEEALRRAGFALFAMVMFVQIFAIISPSKPSLATSYNDIIYGARSKDQVLSAYRSNRDDMGRTDIKAIYNHYGIGVDQILAATKKTIGSHDKDFVSTGRSVSPGVDNFININGVANGGIYQRSLKSWDKNGLESKYNTITGTSQHGFRFWIIIDGCGNIVFERGALKPKLEINKKRTSSNIIKPGDNIDYRIEFRNSGGGSAKNVRIKDKLSKYFDYVSYSSNIDLKFNKNGKTLTWTIDNKNSLLRPTTKWFFIDLHLKVLDSLDVDRVCNSASILATGISAITVKDSMDKRCVGITPEDPPPSDNPEPILSTDKAVTNISQNIIDANNTTAKPGDVLKYTIYVINNGEAPAKDLKLNGEYGESINDILEYADLVDIGDAHFDKQINYLTWDPVTIPANSRIHKYFTVRVKDPLPSTPISASDPLSYDFVMQNIYGRTINIKLDKPATKIIEQTVSTLPNTGPGSNLIIMSAVATVIGFFFYRNKLLSKELEMIHQEYSSGGV